MGILLLIAIVVAVSYYVSLRIWPMSNCSRCQGSGRNAGSTAKRYGRCKKCGGTGRRLRPGARMPNQGDQGNQGRRLSPRPARP
jgi:DnaJ-class molecular chaperone